MTPIPPGEVRQVRRCDDCGFYVVCLDRPLSCKLNLQTFEDQISEFDHVFYAMDKFNRTELKAELQACKSIQCDSNFTVEELQTIINQHNAGEQPHYYGPSEIADLIAEEDRQQSRQEG